MTDSILNINLEADSKENVQRKPPPITTLCKGKRLPTAHPPISPPDSRAPAADLVEDGVPILLQKKATQRFS